MPTVTFNCTKDASALSPYQGWSGWDDHHPVGTSPSGNLYASFLYFPINFAGMTSITSATLKMYGAEVAFVTHLSHTSASELRIRRMTSSWGEGTDRGENLWSTGETWDYTNRANAYTTAGQVFVNTGPISNNVLYSYDVTDIVTAWAPLAAGGGATTNHGFVLKNASTASADGLEYYSRHVSGKVPQLTIVYVNNTAPAAPTGLLPTGGSVYNSLTPTFTGTFSDTDAGDQLSAVQILAYSDAVGTTLVWDSGTLTASGQTFSKTCGVNLAGNTVHSWKARTRDAGGNAWGPYSALQVFTPNTPPPVPTGLSPATNSTVTVLTPAFTGSSDDGDVGDDLNAAQVIVYTDAAGSTVKWDSGSVAASGTTFSVTYAGTALVTATDYWWKARVQDSNLAWSGYTALQKFTSYTVGAPTGLAPANAKVNTLTPTLTATAASTMTSFDITVYASDGVTSIHTVNVVTGGTAISYVYAGTALSWATKYYWKVRSSDIVPVASAYTALQPFWTNSSPSAVQTSPANGAYVSTLTPSFVTNYLDADKSNGFADDPTLYTVEVIDSVGTVMHTLDDSTGLSGTSNSIARVAEGTALSLGSTYRWRARYTDSSGAANALGAYGGYSSFTPVTLGVVSSFVCTDLTAGDIDQPDATFTWAYTATQSKKRFLVYDSSSALIFDSGHLVSATLTYTLADGILTNGASYTFGIISTNSYGLPAVEVQVSYDTAWAPPPALESFSATGDEEAGYVKLYWDQTTVDAADFIKYVVYRSVDAGASWSVIASLTDPAEHFYNDHDAEFGTSYSYKVTQFKDVSGVILESADSDIATTSIESDDWWIVVPDRDDLNMTLIVEDENHESPFQQETFEPFGRTRKVIVRSGILGREGSITFYILAEDRVADIAKLEEILSLNTSVYLKNPFGDTNLVFLNAPKTSYLNGGNVRLQCNYTEVD